MMIDLDLYKSMEYIPIELVLLSIRYGTTDSMKERGKKKQRKVVMK